MKRMLLLAALIVMVSTCVQGQSKDSRSANKAREFMQLQRAEDEAESRKDLAALDRLLSNDFIFTTPGGAVSDKKKFIEGVRNDDEPTTGQTIAYDEVKTYDHGKTTVVNYLLLVKGRDKDGKDYSDRYRNTVVWVRQQGHWRIAAIHVSHIRSR